MSTCSFVDYDTKVRCTALVRDDFSGGFLSCERHQAANWTNKQHHTAKAMDKYFNEVPNAEHAPGFTYFLFMPDGHVKIGCTIRLYERLTELHRDNGSRLIVLAIAKGGFTMEALMHHKFRHLRVTDVFGERFKADPELMAYIASVGIHADAANDVHKYNLYQPRYELAA